MGRSFSLSRRYSHRTLTTTFRGVPTTTATPQQADMDKANGQGNGIHDGPTECKPIKSLSAPFNNLSRPPRSRSVSSCLRFCIERKYQQQQQQ